MKQHTLTLILIIIASTMLLAGGNSEIQLHYTSEHAVFQRANKMISADDMVEDIREYLKYDLRNPISSEVKLEFEIESPGGYHFTFVQLHDGIEIYQSQIKVNTSKEPKIISVLRNDMATESWPAYDLGKLSFQPKEIREFSDFLIEKFQDKSVNISSENIWAYNYELNTPFEAKQVTVNSDQTHEQFEVLLTSEGIEYVRGLNVHVAGTGDVFNPDPLTTAKVEYGLPFVDNNDANTIVLENELQSKDIDVTFQSGEYHMENPFIKIIESSDPVFLPPTSTTPVFEFTRDEAGFEAVNTLYHITEYQQYIQACGFLNLVNYQIQADVHALNGSDQSVFQPAFPPGVSQLLFGDGGVDDAEDADVIVHEYGHAISFSAAPNTNVGSERTAIDEGFGDFVAASYSYSIDTFNWFKVFSWDGHNQYWQGRNAKTTKRYPDDVVSSSIHLTGEIWSSALMKLYRQLGDDMSKIVFQSMYGYAQNMNMPTAAQLLLQADTMLNNGDNYCVLYNELVSRGLVDSISPDPCKFINVPDTTQIRIYNTANFSRSKGPVRIFFPSDLGFKTIEVFDALGRRAYKTITHEQLISIKPGLFTSGSYILVLRVDGEVITEKLLVR